MVVVIVIALAVSDSSQVVNKDDAESTLGNLGYDDATVESCDYLRGTNALNVEMC
ncbi:MAG: hypothetical protein PHF83_00130 [Candidatus Methanomethylophilus sp.]|nr:hypothetical protein [Methanomethylophilus sp.]